jgi:hypothetical protein
MGKSAEGGVTWKILKSCLSLLFGPPQPCKRGGGRAMVVFQSSHQGGNG